MGHLIPNCKIKFTGIQLLFFWKRLVFLDNFPSRICCWRCSLNISKLTLLCHPVSKVFTIHQKFPRVCWRKIESQRQSFKSLMEKSYNNSNNWIMEITLLLPKIKPLQLCKGYNIAVFGTNSVKSIFCNRNFVVESFCRKPIKLVSAISLFRWLALRFHSTSARPTWSSS